MKDITFCRLCHARDILPVLVIESYGDKTCTVHHSPLCGEVLAVVWAKKKHNKYQPFAK